MFNHCDIVGLKICQISNKCKIRAITPFKVIEVGTNQKPVCDFRLVINSNWRPISYRFEVIAAHCSDFLTFCAPPFGGLRDNVRCSSWVHWKARSGLSISVKVLRLRSYGRILVENRWFRSNRGQLTKNFAYKGSSPTNHFSSQKTRLNDLLYGRHICTNLSSILSQITCLTDRQAEFSLLDRVCITCSAVKTKMN